MEASNLVLLFLRKYINISFSIHREAYVASLMFLSGLKVLMDLINPIVPIDIRSSTPTPVLSNFLAMYTTNRKLCSIKIAFASSSYSVPKSLITCVSFSSSNGGGSTSEPPI